MPTSFENFSICSSKITNKQEGVLLVQFKSKQHIQTDYLLYCHPCGKLHEKYLNKSTILEFSLKPFHKAELVN